MANNRKYGNRHRGTLDIIADILEASKGKTRKTYLMHSCNLNFKQLEYYLNFLLKRGLLNVIGEKNNLGLFKITGKGEKFLEAYKGLLGLMNNF